MDGTLTKPIHDFNLIRQQLGIKQGEPILEAIGNMPADRAQETKIKLDDLEMELAHEAVAQPGAHRLLEKLKNTEKQLGILTRNGEEIARVTLRACGLDHFFEPDSIIGRETCAPKPKPDGVEHLLKLWNADRDKTVIVGDYRYDIEAGYLSRIKTVHFDQSRSFEWPEFMDHGIQRLEELIDLSQTGH